MVRRLGLAIAALLLVTLVAVAVVATSASGSSAAPRRVAVQPAAPADAGTAGMAAPPAVDVTATTATTAAPLVSASTTTPTKAAPTTTAPSTAAPTTPRTVKPVATTVVRPAVIAAPKAATPTSGGTASDFSVIGYRWNPCLTITVTSLGPDITAVVAELASITGLHLKMVTGTAQITVMWGTVPPGGEIGYTAWKATGSWLTQAGVVLSQQAQPYLATLLRHELGHAVGLGHATRSNEVMFGTIGTASPTDYQAGDLSGLRSVGAAAGC